MRKNTEGITAGQAAALLFTGNEVIHITDISGVILWAGTGREWEAGKDRDGRPADALAGKTVRHIGATWDGYAGRSAVFLVI